MTFSVAVGGVSENSVSLNLRRRVPVPGVERIHSRFQVSLHFLFTLRLI